jgi:hypothetical protein
VARDFNESREFRGQEFAEGLAGEDLRRRRLSATRIGRGQNNGRPAVISTQSNSGPSTRAAAHLTRHTDSVVRRVFAGRADARPRGSDNTIKLWDVSNVNEATK